MACIFCKIVAGEILHYTVYEDSQVIAFLDIFPKVEGHTVVIPKKHGATIFDFTSDEVGVVMQGVRNASMKVSDILKPDGFTIGLNHGEVAGQAVVDKTVEVVQGLLICFINTVHVFFRSKLGIVTSAHPFRKG